MKIVLKFWNKTSYNKRGGLSWFPLWKVPTNLFCSFSACLASSRSGCSCPLSSPPWSCRSWTWRWWWAGGPWRTSWSATSGTAASRRSCWAEPAGQWAASPPGWTGWASCRPGGPWSGWSGCWCPPAWRSSSTSSVWTGTGTRRWPSLPPVSPSPWSRDSACRTSPRNDWNPSEMFHQIRSESFSTNWLLMPKIWPPKNEWNVH